MEKTFTMVKKVEGDYVQMRIVFPESPPELTAVEIQSVLADLIYLHDTVVAELEPKFAPRMTPGLPRPRRRMRTHPSVALRVDEVRYGSPIELLVAVMDFVEPHFQDILRQVVAGIVTGVVLERRQARRRRREDEQEEELLVPTDVLPEWGDREFDPYPYDLEDRENKAGYLEELPNFDEPRAEVGERISRYTRPRR